MHNRDECKEITKDDEEYICCSNFNANYPCSIRGVSDSGATGNFLNEESPQKKPVKLLKSLSTNQPDGNGLNLHFKSQPLTFPELPTEAR